MTKGRLLFDADNQYLVSSQAQLAFPIEDGIPNMLIDKAMPLNEFKQQFPTSPILKKLND